jgi:flavin-dependent dehydrogenase
VERHDVIVVGGGPGGSSAARALVAAGARVLILDRARFPRVKLCAGWVSGPIWDALELSPGEYPAGLWPWERCHVHFAGRRYAFRARGHFIRRAELDHFLLQRSGAEIREGVAVKSIEADGDGWVINGEHRAAFLVGAGGTHCPVARQLFPPKPRRPVGVQEREFPCDPEAVAESRLGRDGEPELLLHDDLRGYSWNVPKTDWLNVGCGTVDAKQVRDAWLEARSFFVGAGHIPEVAATDLEKMKGHSYYLFDPAHLDDCIAERAVLVGDALGLAHPLTAEGILPAVVSGRLAGEAIAAGDAAGYQRRLRSHPVAVDYTLYYQLREAAGRLRPGGEGGPWSPGPLGRWAAARSFAWMFSGQPLPGTRFRAALQRRAPAVTGRFARRS